MARKKKTPNQGFAGKHTLIQGSDKLRNTVSHGADMSSDISVAAEGVMETEINELDDLQREVYQALLEEMDKVPGPGLDKKQLATFKHCSVGHISNSDSNGDGVDGAYFIGRKKMYPKKRACLWIARQVRGGM